MAIPSSITVPVKIDPQVAWGKTSTAGAGLATTGLIGAVLAFILGDRTPETVAAIVGGIATFLFSSVTVLAGRYLQAHAAVKRTVQTGASEALSVGHTLTPVLNSVQLGDATSLQVELAALEESIACRLTDVINSHLSPDRDSPSKQEGGSADYDRVDDEAEQTVLDAIPDPVPINANPKVKDPDLTDGGPKADADSPQV